MKNNVLVIGGGHHNTLGVVRSLGRKGYQIELILIDEKQRSFVSASKYVSVCHTLFDIKQLAAFLLYRHPTKDGSKEIVISCADAVTEHLNLHTDALSKRYILPGNPLQGAMAKLMDKTTMIKMVAKHQIEAPEVWKIPEDYDKVSFPCLTKALVSSHGGKQDIVICKSKSELDAFLKENKDEIFVQSYIIKKEEVQFIGCSINGGEDIVIPGMTKILRSQPNTNTGFLEYGLIDPFYDDTVASAKEYIRECNYSGLFSIEFLRSQDDRIYFLEINFRNDGNAICVTEAGINLPLIWVKACLGEDYHDEVKQPKCLMVMPEFQDFKLVLQRKISLGKWLKDLIRTDSFMVYAKNDKRPFFQFILNKFIS